MSMTQILPQPATAAKRPAPPPRDCELFGQGYALSMFAPGVYCVRKPDGTTYRVEPARQTCSCPATRECKHLVWLSACLEVIAQRTAREAEAARQAHADAIRDTAIRLSLQAEAAREPQTRAYGARALRLYREANRLFDLASAVRFGGGRLEVVV